MESTVITMEQERSEKQFFSLTETAQLIGVSERQSQTLRKEAESVLGRKLTKNKVEDKRRYLVVPAESIEIIECWRENKDPEMLILRYGNSKPTATQISQIQKAEDWSFVNDEIAVDVEIVEDEETLSIATVAPVQITRVDRSAQVEDLVAGLVLNRLQEQMNQQQLDEAEIARIKEDAKVRFLQRKAAEQEAEQEIKASLERAEAAAKAAMNKGRKGGKRNAPQSF